MYAVIKTGGKQYKVAPNEVVKLEKLEGNVGDKVTFDNVLALSDGKELKIGTPNLQGTVVSAEILEQTKDDKVIIFKKKRRQNYRRKNGHRQHITVVRITEVGGITAPKKVTAKKTTEAPKEEAVAAPKKVATKKSAKAAE